MDCGGRPIHDEARASLSYHAMHSKRIQAVLGRRWPPSSREAPSFQRAAISRTRPRPASSRRSATSYRDTECQEADGGGVVHSDRGPSRVSIIRFASATISSERLFSRLEGLSASARVDPGAKIEARQPFPTELTSTRYPLYSTTVIAWATHQTGPMDFAGPGFDAHFNMSQGGKRRVSGIGRCWLATRCTS